MKNTQVVDLPLWPSKGNRRKLEGLWLQELERHGVSAILPASCDKAPPELYKAIEQFNSGQFWECHETLEGVWRNTPYPVRFFYHGIIKVAVGFHHLSRHNRYGARLKLSEGVRLLRLFHPVTFGVRTGPLSRDASTWLERVESAGPLDWKELDGLSTPHIC